MTKITIEAMLPIFASAKHTIEIESKKWKEMNETQRKEYFLEHSVSDASLCHQCSDGIETSFEIDDSAEFDMWEVPE